MRIVLIARILPGQKMSDYRQLCKRSPSQSKFLVVLTSILASGLFIFYAYGWAASGAEDAKTPETTAESRFNPRTGTFIYSVKWEATPAGEIILTVSKQGDYYRVVADSMVTKAVDFIYRLRYRGEGTISKENFAPVRTVFTEQKGSEKKITRIWYRENGEIETVVTRQKKKETPEETVKKFRPEREVLDIFSAVFLSRSIDWHIGLSEEFEVFTGRKSYIVTLNCLEKTRFQKNDIEVDAWVIAPAALDPNKPDQQPRLTSTRIYLSADESKDILRIKTKTGFGTVEAILTDFVPFLGPEF